MKTTSISAVLPPVSRLAIGSWNTFSRLSVDENVALIRRALDLGVNLFDVGYYWDKPDTEAMFGEVMRRIGIARADYVLAGKLWLWEYPQQSFADQLKTSLDRLGDETVDIIMVSRPLPELDFMAICEEVAALIDAGLARAWGLTNWEPADIERVRQEFGQRGLPLPCLLQMQYNVARREIAERDDFNALFASTDIGLCAAHTLEGGILAGHLDRERVHPSQFEQGQIPVDRNIARDSGGIRERIREQQPELARLAADFGLTAAQAAIAFTQTHPALATTLVGVTRIENLEDNVRALEFERLDELKAAMAPLSVKGVAHPKLFSPTQENA